MAGRKPSRDFPGWFFRFRSRNPDDHQLLLAQNTFTLFFHFFQFPLAASNSSCEINTANLSACPSFPPKERKANDAYRVPKTKNNFCKHLNVFSFNLLGNSTAKLPPSRGAEPNPTNSKWAIVDAVPELNSLSTS